MTDNWNNKFYRTGPGEYERLSLVVDSDGKSRVIYDAPGPVGMDSSTI